VASWREAPAVVVAVDGHHTGIAQQRDGGVELVSIPGDVTSADQPCCTLVFKQRQRRLERPGGGVDVTDQAEQGGHGFFQYATLRRRRNAG
jgi:hypothetical protein